MPEVKVYDVEVNGRTTQLRLSASDAKSRGLKDSDLSSKSARPANKSRGAATKTPAEVAAEKKAAEAAAKKAADEKAAAEKASADAAAKKANGSK